MDFKAVIKNISHYKPNNMQETPSSAAVLVILLTDLATNSIDIVLTKRASSLANYAGHYSFPGGFKEAGDANLLATVKREIQEELALTPETYQIIGQGDDFISKEGDLVRPYVAEMSKQNFLKNCKHASAEIEAVYFLSLSLLAKFKDQPNLSVLTHRQPSYVLEQDTIKIWGLTANILVHLDNIISQKQRPLGKTLVKV